MSGPNTFDTSTTNTSTTNTSTTNTSAQVEVVNVQLAKVRETLGRLIIVEGRISATWHEARRTATVLREVEQVLAMLASGADPAGAVLLKDYDESKYHYYDRIEDDPLWGIDWDPLEDTPGAAYDGTAFRKAFHLHELGWLIRTSKRTPRALKWLYKYREWLNACRSAGVDIYSPAAADLEPGYAERQAAREALAQVLKNVSGRWMFDFSGVSDAVVEGDDAAIADALGSYNPEDDLYNDYGAIWP